MRTLLSQDEAMKILQPYYSDIVGVFTKSFDDLNKYLKFAEDQLSLHHVHQQMTISTLVWNYAISHASNIFNDNANVRPIFYNRVFGLLFYDQLFIRFKKIDKKGNSFNNPTLNSENFNNQSEMQGFPDHPTLLKAGYVGNPFNTAPSEIYIVCSQNSNNVHWKLNIMEKGYNVTYMFPPTDPKLSPEIENMLKISPEKLKISKSS